MTRPLNFIVYENTAWIPTRAQFDVAGADATRQAGLDSLARVELNALAKPLAVGAADNGDAHFTAAPGAVTVASPVDRRWSLQVAGQTVAPRPAFGATTGYDIATGGPATLGYHTASSRALMLVGQLVLWLALALGVSRFDTSTLRRRKWRRGVVRHEAPLLSIDEPVPPVVDDSSAPLPTTPDDAPADEPVIELDEPAVETALDVDAAAVSWQPEAGHHEAGVE